MDERRRDNVRQASTSVLPQDYGANERFIEYCRVKPAVRDFVRDRVLADDPLVPALRASSGAARLSATLRLNKLLLLKRAL
jgi:hypothetical protein